MPALPHLDWEVLAARSFLAMEQVSLVDLMVLIELTQLSLSCLLALWGILGAGLSLQLQLP